MDDLLKSGVDFVEVIKPSSGDASAMWALGWFIFLVAAVGLVVAIACVVRGAEDKKGSDIAYGIIIILAALLLGYCAFFTMGCAIRMANDVETQYKIYVPTEVMALDYAEMTFDSCFNVVKREGNWYTVTMKPKSDWLTYEKAKAIIGVMN